MVLKRTSIALSKEDLRILEELQKKLGESQSAVLKRALIILNEQIKKEKKSEMVK